MKTRTFTSVGSMHPVLFFAVVYILALGLSIFVCSSLFYSCNASGQSGSSTVEVKPEKEMRQPAPAVAMR